MAESNVEIPNRAAFKASDVCEVAQIPPYVLRSWEKEFPRLGAAARPGGARIYTRSDIEQILRIKQLVFAEGLTLAGARRRLEGDPPVEEETPLFDAVPVPAVMRERVARAKRDLRSLLEMLSQPAAAPAVSAAEERPVAVAPSAEPAVALPLLDGVADSPPTSRRPKRAAKGRREDAPSNVE